ncbi:MAG: bile acid:sodium symporter [Thermoguttaceae bacterium]|jgi:BASS family bile acid:Na+ symporter
MTMDQLINVLVTITLVELMVAIGLGVALADLAGVATNGRLMGQAALANYVCVPAAAVGLLLLFRPEPMVAAGFLIAAVCPGAPYGPPFTAMAKGSVAVSVGLMVVLAGSSALLAPLLLHWLLPLLTPGSESLNVDVTKMVFTLLAVQLLPLCVGLTVRQWRPKLAARLSKPANLLSVVLNMSVIGLVLVVHFQTLVVIRPRGFAGMLALVLAALIAGWLLGMPGSSNRKAMAITTSVRNVGVSLVIATGSFAGTPAVTATLAFALFQTILLALVALGWGRLAPITC